MNLLQDRREEERQRRRNDILDACACVARECGLSSITMEQVAQRARLSRALIYVYFQDRDDLLFGLSERSLLELRRRFESAVEQSELGLDKVRACGLAYLRFARELPLEFEVLSRLEAHAADVENLAASEAACLQAGDAVHQLIVRSIALGMQDGSIREDVGEPGVVAATLWGFLHGVLQLAANKANVLKHEGVDLTTLVDRAIQLATRSIASDAAIRRGGIA